MPVDTVAVLLVEDNLPDARLVEFALAEIATTRFAIMHSERLAPALRALEENNFDAVLLDLSLPDSRGLDTVRQVMAVAPAVPIIVLSALNDEQVAVEAVKVGAQDYLVKGLENGVLISRAIHYAIERKKAEESLRAARNELEDRVEERTASLMYANLHLRREMAEREQAEAARRASEHQLSVVTDALPVLISYVDAQERYRFNNRAYEDWFGVPRAALAGRTVREVIGEGAYRAVRHHIALALAGQPVSFENLLPYQGAGERYIHASYIPDMADSGVVRGFFALVSDVTERKRAADRERQHLLDLAHAARLSTMGEMSTQVAHELNQPLTAIAGYGEACLDLVEEMVGTDELRELLGKLVQQALRAGDIIRQLRSFARKGSSARAPHDINALVREVISLIEMEARWHGVAVRLDLGSALVAVWVDRLLVEQVLVNLVRNALEAMAPTEHTERRLHVRTEMDAGEVVRVTVRDTGPGLPPDTATRVFESFYTTKPNGVGIGLSISRSIVEAHGGRLSVENSPEGGCIFSFTLPISEPEDHDGID